MEVGSDKERLDTELRDMAHWLSEVERDRTNAKNDLAELKKVLMASNQRIAELEIQLTNCANTKMADNDNKKVKNNEIATDREVVSNKEHKSDDIEMNTCCLQAVK